MPDDIILYGHQACPHVAPLKSWLDRQQIAYRYVNIHQHRETAARVQEINDGYESVPTLVFPDGSTLTEPSLRRVEFKLSQLGYETAAPSWIPPKLWFFLLTAGSLVAVLWLMDVI